MENSRSQVIFDSNNMSKNKNGKMRKWENEKQDLYKHLKHEKFNSRYLSKNRYLYPWKMTKLLNKKWDKNIFSSFETYLALHKITEAASFSLYKMLSPNIIQKEGILRDLMTAWRPYIHHVCFIYFILETNAAFFFFFENLY